MLGRQRVPLVMTSNPRCQTTTDGVANLLCERDLPHVRLQWATNPINSP